MTEKYEDHIHGTKDFAGKGGKCPSCTGKSREYKDNCPTCEGTGRQLFRI